MLPPEASENARDIHPKPHERPNPGLRNTRSKPSVPSVEVVTDFDILPRTSHFIFGGLGVDLAVPNQPMIFGPQIPSCAVIILPLK
jgi:hypothetical protein